MKKFATIALAVVLSMGILTGCGSSKKAAEASVLERAHARRLGVKTHPRVVDPAHDCS